MSYAPDTLVDLGLYWTNHKGVNLGIIGNQKHCAGYHLGKDRIFSDCACKPDGTCEPGRRWADYSVSLTRDKNGLTNAASAIDLGRLDGSLEQLYKFSRWLVAQCQAKKPGFADVREIIYSPDGEKVQRYSGVDGLIHTGPGNGDLSHRTHTHISYFRDAEKRDKRPLFAPYFDTTHIPEDPVRSFTFGSDAVAGTFRSDGEPGHLYLRLKDNTLHPYVEPMEKHAFGPVELTDGGIGGPNDPRNRGYVIGAEAAFVLVEDGTFAPLQDTVAAARERDRAAHLANLEEVYAA